MVGRDQIPGGHDVLPKPGVVSTQGVGEALKIMVGEGGLTCTIQCRRRTRRGGEPGARVPRRLM